MACGLIGSMGLGASGNYSFAKSGEIDVALFDPAGGTAPDIAGRGVCNPTAALLAFALLLEHAREPKLAVALRESILDSIASGKTTRDVGGTLGTADFTARVCDALGRRIA
jgi:isocitrate dehydrogenase (NAD+)